MNTDRPASLSLPHLAAVEDLLAATRGLWGNLPGARPKPAVSSPSPVVLVFRRDGGSVDTALIDSERRINRAHYDLAEPDADMTPLLDHIAR